MEFCNVLRKSQLHFELEILLLNFLLPRIEDDKVGLTVKNL